MRKLAILLCLPLLGPIAASSQQVPKLPPISTDNLPAIVARINGEEIKQGELIAQAQTMRYQAVEAGASDPGQSSEFLSLVLDALIGERLVYADSKTRGVNPTEAEIAERVKAVVAAYGGDEGLDRALEKQGLDRQYVKQQVTQTLSFNKMMESEIQPAITISEEAIAGYYERSQNRFKVPASYKVRHVMKKIPEQAGAEARQAGRSQVEAIRQQVIGGADFAALAKEHSEDEKTRDQGGELPWIVLTGGGGVFDEIIAGLEVGELSNVVETPEGIHLIRLEDRKLERIKTLEEARPEIASILAASEARREIQRRVERLRAEAKIEVLM